jgi:hypothetical protein
MRISILPLHHDQEADKVPQLISSSVTCFIQTPITERHGSVAVSSHNTPFNSHVAGAHSPAGSMHTFATDKDSG